MKKLLAVLLTITTIILVLLFLNQKNDLPVSDKKKPLEPISEFSPLPLQKEFTFAEAVSEIKAEDLKKDLYHLTSDALEGRMSGKNGHKLAATYVEDLYKKFGLETMRHRFPMSRYNPGPKNETGDAFSENVYAWIEGNDPNLKNEIVVVGAHLDHLGYGPTGSMSRKIAIHPGADDNASGSVALIRIAEAFSKLKKDCKRTVVFMSFSGEEMGLIGSKYYCENPVFPKNSPSMAKHVAMINMDMIGYLKKGEYQASFFNESSSIDLGKIISDLDKKYSFAKSITGRGSGGSDHAPFYNKKVPVACLHTGMHKQYHTPEDTADKINYSGLEQITRYAFEMAYQVVISENRPRFDLASFAPMKETHDHDKINFPINKKNHD